MKIIRSTPLQNRFFQEETLQDGNTKPSVERGIINIYDDCTYQSIQGFGGAFTESAAYNYAKLTNAQKCEFMEKYFSRKHGIAYNFGRTHINSCDFSLDIYTYVTDGDLDLSTFSIDRDKKYIIPFIKDAMAYCEGELALFASPWSPPAYMKDNESPIRGGALKEQYQTVWARYYAKYIKAMAAEGVHIAAISVQNEPNACQPWESCSYTPAQEREFIEKHLFPVLDEEGLSHVKVIIWDHNKERVYDRTKEIFESETVQERVWAVGHHWYSGDHFEGLQLVHETFGKTLISFNDGISFIFLIRVHYHH
jgi:glucosylceramidase